MVTLSKIPGGSFVAKEMIVSEAEFIAATVKYMRTLSPAEKKDLRRATPVDDGPPPPPSNGDKKFRVARVASAAT